MYTLFFYLKGYRNDYVVVKMAQTSTTVNCTFLKNETTISCNVTVDFGENCQNSTKLFGKKKSRNLVSVDLSSFLQDTMGSRYCNFTVTATSGTKLLYVERVQRKQVAIR